MTKSSAPGKVILFGEHAVVYERPALAVPVTQVHTDVEVEDSDEDGIWIDAPDVDLHAELSSLDPAHPLRRIVDSVFASSPNPHPSKQKKKQGYRIRIASTIPVASGLGSGAAVSVALTRALSTHLGRPMNDEQVNELAYEVEKLHHGTPSGIDNTVITYARPVFFVKGQPVETFHPGAPFSLVIGDTGISAPTRESVGDVHKLWEADPPQWEAVFDQVGEIVRQARKAIESGETDSLGPLMDHNHFLLDQMTVSSPELNRLIVAAWSAGALGAKLSGGGRGGNMIALVQQQNAEEVAQALKSAGAKRAILTTVGS